MKQLTTVYIELTFTSDFLRCVPCKSTAWEMLESNSVEGKKRVLGSNTTFAVVQNSPVSSMRPMKYHFHTVHGVLKARIPKRFAIPFSSGPHSVSYIYFIKLNEFPGSVPVPDFPVYDSGHFSPAALHASLFLFILNSAIYLLSHIVVSA